MGLKNVLTNAIKKVGFVDEIDEELENDVYGDEYDDGDETENVEPAKETRSSRAAGDNPPVTYRKTGNIETMKPATYGDAHKIIEKLREGNIIVFSLELVDDDLAVRILDFVYGGTYALSGKIKEVGTRVYVVTNYGVNLSEITGATDSQQQKAPSYK